MLLNQVLGALIATFVSIVLSGVRKLHRLGENRRFDWVIAGLLSVRVASHWIKVEADASRVQSIYP